MADVVRRDTDADVVRTEGGNDVSPARWYARIAGIAFLIIGIWGFFDRNPFNLGMELTPLHNWIHLLSGLVLVYVGFAPVTLEAVARTVLAFGVIYGLVFLIGLFVNDLAGLMYLYAPDDILHAILTVAALATGWMSLPERAGRMVERRRPTV